MDITKTSTGRCSKRSTGGHANKVNTLQSLLLRHNIPLPLLPRNIPATGRRRRSWTPEQLSDANYLKVPASMWKDIHGTSRTEWIDAAENTLTATLAAGALLSKPIVGLVKVHKWFWDKSIETKDRKDTYRYRVIDQATDVTILPEDEWYDPVEDDESKIKILYVGLPVKEHLILLLRRICPDASMEAIQSADEWTKYLAPSIRAGYYQIKRSTTYGWSPVISRKKKGRNTQLPTSTASPSLRSKKTPVDNAR